MRKQFIFYFIFIISSSCNTGKLKPIDYVRWVQDKDNNLRQTREMENVVYELQFKPIDYIIALEEKKNNLNRRKIIDRRNKLKNAYYFTLNIRPKDGKTEILSLGLSDQIEYNNRLNYASYEFQNQIYMIEGKDTTACTQYHFEQKYGIEESVNLLIGFERKKKNITIDKIIVINDNLLNGGIIAFRYAYSDLKLIPTMLIN